MAVGARSSGAEEGTQAPPVDEEEAGTESEACSRSSAEAEAMEAEAMKVGVATRARVGDDTRITGA